MKRLGLTAEAHVECGRLIVTAYRDLTAAFQLVQRGYGKSHPAARGLLRIIRLAGPLTKIKGYLDSQVCTEVPRGRDPRNLATRVYYAEGLVQKPGAAAGANDAFAGYDLPAER